MANGDGNLLTRDLGGLPVWGWAGFAIAAGAIVIVIRRRGAPEEKAPPDFEPQPASLAEGLPTEQYESLLAVLRDLQGRPSSPVPAQPPSTTPKPPSGTPPAPTKGPGTTFTIPSNFVPAGQMGYSHVMRKIMQQFYGLPLENSAARSKIWYHPNNAALVARYAANWTKLRAGDKIYLPKITV